MWIPLFYHLVKLLVPLVLPIGKVFDGIVILVRLRTKVGQK